MTLVGWMIEGVPTVMRGEFAERDAMAAAKRIGGTCRAFAVYRDAPVVTKPESRPQNCGTGHCSCIVCPYVKPTTGTNQ